MTFWSFLLLLLAVVAAAGWTLSRMRLNRLKVKYRTELEELRVAHERALRDHAQRLQALLDSMVEGILVLDEHQGVVLTNRAAAKMFESSYPATGRALLETVRHHE